MTTATPLLLPFSFGFGAGNGSRPDQGPVIPSDWRSKWNGNRGLDDDDGDWADDGSDGKSRSLARHKARYVTAMTSWVEEEEKEFTGGEESKDVLLETQVERPDDGRLRSTGSTASLRSVASTSRSGRDLGKAEAAGASDSIGESSMTLDGSVENKEAEGEGEGEVSRRRKRMRLGGSAGARVALGLRDGSVWIFGHGNGDQADAAAHQEPSLTTTSAPDISTLATPRRERSSSRATIGSGLSVRRGAVSPNDGRRDSVVSQAHSTNTQTHRGSSASQLPFAGFPHAATSPTTSTSHAIASPTSRFDDGDQWSIAAGASAHGDVHSPPMRAEEELESQANRAENHGVVGGMMEALGFGTGHSHHHGKHATAGGDATAGTGSARLTSPALPRTHSHSRSNARGSVVIPPSETGSSSLPTPTSASRKSVPSSTGKDQTGATRGSSSRDTPNEGSASFGAMGAALAGAGNLGSLGIGGGQRAAGGPDVALEDSRRRVPAAGSGSGSGSMGRFEARERGNSPGIDTDTLLGDTTVPVARLDGDGGLREMRPLVQLVTADRSPVVDVRLVEQGAGDRALIVLQEGGQLSTWSLQDGTCQSHLNLSHTQAYPPPAQAESHNLAPAHATSGPFATLASLRSHANSPAPSLRSRSGSNAGLKAPAGAQERKGKVHVEFEELQIVNEAENTYAACFDASRNRVCVVVLPEMKMATVVELPDCSGVPLVCSLSGRIRVAFVNSEQHLLSVSIQFPHSSSVSTSTGSRPPTTRKAGPFLRAEDGKRAQGDVDGSEDTGTKADEPIDHGRIDGLEGDVVRLVACGKGIVAWTMSNLTVFTVRSEKVEQGKGLSLPGIREVLPLDDENLLAVTQDKSVIVELTGQESRFGAETSLPSAEAATWYKHGGTRQLLAATMASDNLQLVCGDLLQDHEASFVRTIYSAPVTEGEAKPEQQVTAVLPLSMERVALSLASGHLVLVSLAELVNGKELQPNKDNASRYGGHISLLQSVTNPRTQAKHILGGTDEGEIIFWDASTLKLQAEWSLFASPLVAFVQLGQESTLRLHGCIACVSSDGTVAIILLDGLKLLHVVPGRDAPLEQFAVRADELLLIYEDERARVWDMRTQELRRSVGADQAMALIDDGAGRWSQHLIDPSLRQGTLGGGVLQPIVSARRESASTVLADLRRAIEAASRAATPPPSQGSYSGDAPSSDAFDTIGRSGFKTLPRTTSVAGIRKVLNIQRPLLAVLLPIGMDERIDEKCAKILGVQVPDVRLPNVGLGTHTAPGLLARALTKRVLEGYTISSAITTTHLLAVISMLRNLINIEDYETAAADVITFIVAALPELVGPAFQHPSLATLVSYFMDSNAEIRDASRLLFSAFLSRMSQPDVDALCEEWQESLPCLQPPVSDDKAPLALSLLGLIATERYKMLSPSLLKDIASSISIYINDNVRGVSQAIAIELCCRGFSIWQHYLDAMEVVRTLFGLATNKESGALVENRALARQATLHIASANTPLFMTTLSLDILHARSPAHCSATMRLVAFMVRKKPLILYPNLPRLAEAVVKSLDPTVTAMREAVVQAATVMINELVSTYPSIAFHGRLQRLAVGTHEGAVIMYDLKTATRLYVLEGHRRQLAACSFAPDGRRLITVSLEEGKVLIWKVGSSITSIFMPGIMPRQGATDESGAYKAIDFNVGAASLMSTAEVLEAVTFEWQDDRSVRLNVGEASMTFSVS